MAHRLFSCLVSYRFAYAAGILGLAALLMVPHVSAQTESATVLGRVTDPTGAVVNGVAVEIRNIDTNVVLASITNAEGLYAISGLRPGRYVVFVRKEGFKSVSLTNINLNVQDNLVRNFVLQVGAVSESITVTADSGKINTTDASVGTVIDHQFVDKLPLNGRSFNTLLQLTPGVIIAPSNPDASPGQFSMNGQRTNANSFQVDGVSANFGTGAAAQTQLGGGAQAFNAFGGTSSLVSVDALQEFRIETSSYAPEFGRTPGGQVIISTRSGTNQFHGNAFDYLRNDVFDANDWFANAAPAVPGTPHHPPERQNDFGGVFGGPIFHDHTFFFFSYEGLRLRQPEVGVSTVPTVSLRNAAVPAASAILNAFPLPDDRNAPGDLAPFTARFSNRVETDAASLRVDHNFGGKLGVFARYNFSPSMVAGNAPSSPQILDTLKVNTTTVTGGINAQISRNLMYSLRLNYSRQQGQRFDQLDSTGGAQPLNENALFPSGTSAATGQAIFDSFDGALLVLGTDSKNRTSQWNLVNDLTVVRGAHQLKFGADYRRLLLDYAGQAFSPQYIAFSISSFASSGTVPIFLARETKHSKVLFPAFSAYGQDQWRITPRLTATYGVRWELNPAPAGKDGTTLLSWKNAQDPAQISLAPLGAPVWNTTYANFAPRLGIAYRVTPKGDLVIRSGWGIFYDLGTGASSNLVLAYPNTASSGAVFGTFQVPLPNAVGLVPPVTLAPPFSGLVEAFSQDLKLPLSYQWNVAVEKSLGSQALSMTYLGQVGSRLLRNEQSPTPNGNFSPGTSFVLTRNGDTSDYNALQIQFRRAMAARLQALLNYTWSHSIDTSSGDTGFVVPGALFSPAGERGSSDFDVRHAFTAGFVYEVPAVQTSRPLAAVINGWTLESTASVRSGLPVPISTFVPVSGNVNLTRPDLVPGQPIWLSGTQFPGGQALNPAAFAIPTTLRQGTLGRNAISGFPFAQLDLSLTRKFTLTERIHLLFETNGFNILNHPNFSNFGGAFGNVTDPANPLFGIATQMVNQGIGGLNALYQMGGPRSLQLSLKLGF
jgi:hypothetical protein